MKRTILSLIVCFLLLAILSACGGNGKAKQEATAERYRANMQTWALEMTGSALQVSDMFSGQQTLTALLDGDAAAIRKLNASVRTLTACSKRVKALGAAPPKYRHVRAVALRACANFEAGAGLVHAGLIAAQGGLGSDLLVEGAGKLSDGVSSIPASELKGSSKKDQEIENEANLLRQGS